MHHNVFTAREYPFGHKVCKTCSQMQNPLVVCVQKHVSCKHPLTDATMYPFLWALFGSATT